MASVLAKQVAAHNQQSRERRLAGMLTTLDWRRSLEFNESPFAHIWNPLGNTTRRHCNAYAPVSQGLPRWGSSLMPQGTL